MAGLSIALASSNVGWGGSEELWTQAAAALARDGHRITVLKDRLDAGVPVIQELSRLGARLVALERTPFSAAPLHRRIPQSWRFTFSAHRFGQALQRLKPDLVVLSQGGNDDGWRLGAACRRLGLRYVLIAQFASDMQWPSDGRRRLLQPIYRDAAHCFFVSEHNKRLTEEQLGIRIDHASVVRNPFKVPWAPRTDWPDGDGLRLACVGRLHPEHKGQDILLRVLAQPKWRARPVSLTLFGTGGRAQGLEGLAAMLGLERVRFAGQVADVSSIWDDHHCLALPSRAEGLPLVLVEAMLSNRVPIATRVAGIPEMVEDGVSGFLADAPTEAAFDEALERAWAERDALPAIGRRAGKQIRVLVPENPARAFADRLCELCA